MKREKSDAIGSHPSSIWQVRVSRRTFLFKVVPGALLAQGLAIAATSYPVFVEPTWLDVTHLPLRFPDLPKALNGLRLVQFSDVHISPYVGESYLRGVARQIMAQRGDIILFTGDMVTRATHMDPTRARLFSELDAPLGVWGVLGNHDHWADPDATQAFIEETTSIRVLRNEHVRLDVGDARIWLVGVDDAWVGADNPERAFAGVPEDEFRLVLMHEPDAADWLPFTPLTLQLSGHSHGGQVRLPLIGPPLLPYLGRKYDMGLYAVKGGQLYTNRGIGLIAPPVRFNCRPEITVITLLRA